MSTARRRAAQYKVGDWVSFLYGTRKAVAQIIEDRGRLGVHGCRIYRVRLDQDHGEPTTFEVREEDLIEGKSDRETSTGNPGDGSSPH